MFSFLRWNFRVPLVLFIGFAMIGVPVANAQDRNEGRAARIVGRIIDSRTGAGLSDVGIQVVGTTTGAASGLDGRFVISSIAAGTVTMHVRRLGYVPKTVTGIVIDPGETIEQDITLEPLTVSLSTQIVTASSERGSVSEALDRQRMAAGVINAVTREQISRSPDADAAQAMQRVSGVTVQDGKYVFVRGLGERYTTTSLNGARIPSPEPERKVVPLDLFPASLLQTVTTSKNFTPDQPGDFAGAHVDIRTRDFPARAEFRIASAAGVNDAATGRSIVGAPLTGSEWLGFAGTERQLPDGLRNPREVDGLTQRDINARVASLRNAWTPRVVDGTFNRSLGISGGGSGNVGPARAGYITAFSYSYGQEVRENEVRAYAEPTDDIREIDRFEGLTGRSSVLWGGILNGSLMFNARTRVSLSNTYNRSADNEARQETGFSENLGSRLLVDRIRFVERRVASSQLVGERQIGARHRIEASFTASSVRRSEPDRSEFVRVAPGDGLPFWLDGSEGAVRTFGDLSEKSYNSVADYFFDFGPPRRAGRVKVGGAFLFTERLAVNRVFSVQAPALGIENRVLLPEQIFDGRYATDTSRVFRLVPLSQGGSYGANEEVGAGYAMLDWNLAPRVQVIAGVRVERSSTIVSAEPTVGRRVITNPRYTDWLPSVLLTLRASDQQNLRFSATQTLARPEYRELAEVQYRDVIGGENVMGNPSLERTLIRNADARWEFYPRVSEVVSIGVFAKHFVAPIERVFLATSGTRVVTFINADGADNYGVELEARLSLDRLGPRLAPFTALSNVTVMKSTVRLGSDPRVASEKRAMVGQAPVVVNAGLSYARDGALNATILFNHVGRRILSASQSPLPVTYEEARSSLDFSLRVPVASGISGKFDARNILDNTYRQTQGPVTRESYRSGRVYTVGLTWTP